MRRIPRIAEEETEGMRGEDVEERLKTKGVEERVTHTTN